MFLKTIIILLIISLKLPSTSAILKYFKKSNNAYSRFGVLTAYKNIGNTDISEFKFRGCEADKIWIFARHGSRYPFKNGMQHLFAKAPIIQENVNYKAGSGIKEWRPLFNMRNYGQLMKTGQKELFQLGERFRLRFPTVIKKNCHDKAFRYKSTDTDRTKESARKFGLGLLGKGLFNKCWREELKDKRLVMEFSSYCPKWRNDVYKKDASRMEESLFKRSKIVRKMLDAVSKRFGYNFSISDERMIIDVGNGSSPYYTRVEPIFGPVPLYYKVYVPSKIINITFAEQVELISKICAYETAFYDGKSTSPWCNMLLPDEFEIIEYMNDLYSYWVHGYGYPVTYQQACPMLEDMLQFLDSDNDRKLMAYFGHDTIMWKIVALLGIANDKRPLLSDSTRLIKNRKWRSSLISPFAANIAFVSYKCGTSNEPRILFLHQERIVTLPGCPAKKPCPINTMKRFYQFGKCEFEKWCLS